MDEVEAGDPRLLRRVALTLMSLWLVAGCAAASIRWAVGHWSGRSVGVVEMVVLASGWGGLVLATPPAASILWRLLGETRRDRPRSWVWTSFGFLSVGLVFTVAWGLVMAGVVKLAVTTRTAMPVGDAILKSWLQGLPTSLVAFALLMAAVLIGHLRREVASGKTVVDLPPSATGEVASPCFVPSVIRVPTVAGHELVPVREVTWIEARDYQAAIHTDGRTYLVRESLKTLGGDHARAGLFRVHRSALVNLGAIVRVRRGSGGGATAVLHDGSEVPVSRRRRTALLRALEARD